MTHLPAEEILRKIPHRPPFLWVDRIVSLEQEHIVTEKDIPSDLEVFKGHFPDYPVMPGVLLCEAVFQSGALLISEKTKSDTETNTGIPLLTRINDAKFKRSVKPGDRIRVEVTLNDVVGTAWFMKGRVMVDDKVAVKVEFACTIGGV